MFKARMMVLKDDSMVDSITRIAANYRLQCLYKIGIYGNERQHELYIVGWPWRYWAFMKEFKVKKR